MDESVPTDVPADAEQDGAPMLDDTVPSQSREMLPVVGLGGSAGGIQALTAFFDAVPPDPGVAFVVILHLSPEHESTLAELLQRHTAMPVLQVQGAMETRANTVYVIPPGRALRMLRGRLELGDLRRSRSGRAAVDLFYRSLADTHGPHAVAVVLSGADSDGAVGLKRIKERGGLTIAQDPDEAEHGGMPRAAIATGMVDWVLPAAEMPRRLLDYIALEDHLKLPPEQGALPPAAAAGGNGESDLREVLAFLRNRTGRDFSNYKRATILRRIARRMQVNGVTHLNEYLGCLRTRPGEAGALLQDLLISVTNFFRDPDCFGALEGHLPALFRGKGAGAAVRVWVAACATGEEAYSIAMLLAEHARTLDAPPAIQVFATDLDEEAVRTAREGVYPLTITADVSEERLRLYFTREHRGYRVRRELRESVLFAAHDVLKDSPFSRLDMVSCRNLLIYLNREAQHRVLETAHFALVPDGRLFLGASETVEDDSPLFVVLDKKHRIYAPRAMPRSVLPVPIGQGFVARALEAQNALRPETVIAGPAFRADTPTGPPTASSGRSVAWAELHFKMLESLAPPSVLVDANHDIVHLSMNAGRFLQFGGGEPSRNLLQAVHPGLRLELRAALYQAAQSGARTDVTPLEIDLGHETVGVHMSVRPMSQLAVGMMLVLFEPVLAPGTAQTVPTPLIKGTADPLASMLDRELERLKAHLRDTVEQYEASTEELKASNEELQAMNEELRSATEELETSREELQSINEELTTVNQELKSKVDELGHANSDIQNLMDATAIATLFLDRDLRITRYTPPALELFNLIPTDLGRPLSHLTTRLDYADLDTDARRVLQTLIPIEREVVDSQGRWFMVRMLPYRTVDDRIAGVVLTLVDITQRKHDQGALRRSEDRFSTIVGQARVGVVQMSRAGRISLANRFFCELLGFQAGELDGSSFLERLAPDDRAGFMRGLNELPAEGAVLQFTQRGVRKDGTTVWLQSQLSDLSTPSETGSSALMICSALPGVPQGTAQPRSGG